MKENVSKYDDARFDSSLMDGGLESPDKDNKISLNAASYDVPEEHDDYSAIIRL